MASKSPLGALAAATLARVKQRSRHRAYLARRTWTTAEEELLRARYPDEPTDRLAAELGLSIEQVYAKANRMGLHKSPAYAEQCLQACGHQVSNNPASARSRFQAGADPWNKGMKGLQAGGRSAETQFKPGCIQGRAAALVQPVGAERVTRDGIRQRKIRADGPFHRRWKSVHSILWEETHGPIPAGHVVVFRDGNTTNIVADNLELITRHELMRRNTIHRYPPELVDAIRTISKLKRTIREVDHEEQA